IFTQFLLFFFFFYATASSEIYTLSLHDALPIYTQDAFSRSGWLCPVDAKGEPLKATSYMAVGFYVAKYVNKKSDMDLAAKGLGEIGRAVQQECRYRSRMPSSA